MPTVRITNKTSIPLNLALSHICPLNHVNAVEPGGAWETRVGRVWFTVECRADTGPGSRYSVSKSAKTIAMVSLATVSVAAVAGPMVITGAAALTTSTAVSALASSSAVAAASTTEALAVTTFAASQLTTSTLRRVALENGMSPAEADEMMKQVEVVNGLVMSITPAGAAKSALAAGSKKAVLKAAGTLAVQRVFRGEMEKRRKDADKVVANGSKDKGDKKDRGLEQGKVQRVLGVYMGKPRNFEWREKVDGNGIKTAELWDMDADRLVD